MPVGPNPAYLKIAMVLGALFTAGCSDSGKQLHLSFGSVQIAEQGKNQPTTNRALQLWMRVAHQAIDNGHPDTAIRFAQKAVRAFPENDEPLRILALAYGQKDDGGIARFAAVDTANDHAGVVTGRPPNKTASASPLIDSTSPAKQPQLMIRKSPYPLVARSTSRVSNNVHKVEKKQRIQTVAYSKRTRSSQPAMPTGSSRSGYRIQLAAYSDLRNAIRGRDILTKRLPNDVPELEIFMRHRATAKGKRVNYRLRSRALTTRSQALSACRSARAAGLSCLPIRQTSNTWRLVKTGAHTRTARAVAPGRPRTVSAGEFVGNPVKNPVAASASRPLFRIQLAAYRNLAKAVHGKQILTRNLPQGFPRLEILKRNGITRHRTRINYWVRSQDVWNEGRARALCNEARSRGHPCLLIEPRKTIWRPIMANR